MPVIDCHQHFWEFGKRVHKFPATVGARLDSSFTPDDLRPQLKAAGVDATILVQPLNGLDETREFLGLSRTVDDVAGVVGWCGLPIRWPASPR
jgi:L-fuconolactonase